MATIGITGLWHQGVVLCACFAELGHNVRGVDHDVRVIDGLRDGRAPVYEPDLDALLQIQLREGRLQFTTDVADGFRDAEFVFVALDTPMRGDDTPDLEPVLDRARDVAPALSKDAIVVVTAQVPVGTCEQIEAVMTRANPRVRTAVAYVPEFLRLGQALETFRRADRFVVGADAPGVAARVAALYRPLERPIVLTTRRTAEMAKHAANAFLATSISAVNELADLCDRVGADVVQVAEIMKLDHRIGPQAYLSPGLGFAGGTLGRDVRALQELGRANHCGTPLMDAVMQINTSRPGLVGRHLQEILGTLQGAIAAVFGLTYKAGTSTLRRSIGIEIIRDLVARGASIRAFDPLARMEEGNHDLPPFVLCSDPYDAARGCDAVVLITPWAGMDALDLSRLRSVMRRPVFIDTRNQFDPGAMRTAGFLYAGIGRGTRAGAEASGREGGRREPAC